MVQKFCESLQISVKVNFRAKNFVITLNFRDLMLTRLFFSECVIEAKTYSQTDMYTRIPDFTDLSAVTTVTNHQSNKTYRQWYDTQDDYSMQE